MLSTMITPVLTLDESRISNYDPQDPVDLSLLWSAFSKTSHIVEQGERLRNFSWRLWNKERLCTSRNRLAAAARSASSPTVPRRMPDLSSSVDSSSSTETEEDASGPATACPEPTDVQARPQDRHITPVDLQNLVHSIKQPRELKRQTRPKPLAREAENRQPAVQRSTILQPSSPRHVTTESSTSTVATATTDSFASAGTKSDTSVSSGGSSQHSIVRGFTPGTGVTSYTSKYQIAPAPQPQPILKKPSPDITGMPSKKPNGMFMLGCSSGSGASAEDEDSLRNTLASHSLRSSGYSQKPSATPSKKQTSFKDEVAVMKPHAHEDAAVFDDSEEEDSSDDEVSESAIDDDDDAWEDEGSDSVDAEPKKPEEMQFYRVDSRAHLPTRRSALTLNLEDQRTGGQQNRGVRSTPSYKRSRNSTPNGPSMPGSPEEDSQIEIGTHATQSSRPIIPTTTNIQPQPLAPLTSPRTTRRNMIAGELSESLRKNMLSEHQQRNPLRIDANQMRRAHTAFDVSRLSRLPEQGEPNSGASSKDVPNRRGQQYSWNHYFDNSVGEYHQAGW